MYRHTCYWTRSSFSRISPATTEANNASSDSDPHECVAQKRRHRGHKTSGPAGCRRRNSFLYRCPPFTTTSSRHQHPRTWLSGVQAVSESLQTTAKAWKSRLVPALEPSTDPMAEAAETKTTEESLLSPQAELAATGEEEDKEVETQKVPRLSDSEGLFRRSMRIIFGSKDKDPDAPQDNADDELPASLEANVAVLTVDEQNFSRDLVKLGQGHLFAEWDAPGVNDDEKRQMLAELRTLDANYVGGVRAYITRAKELLASSQRGENPLSGWTPSVPVGMNLDPENDVDGFLRLEGVGLQETSKCAFVLVAGGLGERLGYGGIKIGLPVETLTSTLYIQLYAAFLKSYGDCPMLIMTSDDTHERTNELLSANDFFGLPPERITLAKPHGHGDVHKLVLDSGKLDEWRAEGREWVVFLQDTNGLGLLALPAMLGVSKELDLEVNSAAIPRKAKQEIGAIATLTHDDGRVMTVNVEYNQLEPLLKDTIQPEGDTADETTGNSPFPGNINQLVFKLGPYADTLAKTQGVMPEFVNPKYADEARSKFSKPTRLECMMQDYPKLLGPSSKVGFTQMPAWLCFSPCKNSLQKAASSIVKKSPPACAASAEADQYAAYATLLRIIGVNVEQGVDETFEGIPVTLKPSIVLSPSFATCLTQLRDRFTNPAEVRISKTSALIVGGDTVIDAMDLNGIAEFAPSSGKLQVQNCTVNNEGHNFVPIEQSSGLPEALLIRGYKCNIFASKDNYVFTTGPVDTTTEQPTAAQGCGCTVM